MFKIKVKKVLIILIWVILLFYNFHRYIFKYNSSLTSPTYQNTPVLWQSLKYFLLFVIVLLFYLSSTFKKRVDSNIIVFFLIINFILIINILGFFFYDKMYIDEIQYIFFAYLLFPYFFVSDSIYDFKIDYTLVIKLSALILYFFNAIAVFNFLVYKRLPALGYNGGLVRFGSFWDDPNSYGFFCVFFSIYFFDRKQKLLFLFSIINLLLTFSFSAYLLFILSILYCSNLSFMKIKKKWANLIVFVILFFITIFYFYYDLIISLYSEKKYSIDEHLHSNLVFNFFPFQNSFFQFSENWYRSFFFNYFPISIIILFLIFYLFIKLFVSQFNFYKKYFLILSFCSFFFIPFLYSFPLNFLFLFLLIDFIKQSCVSNSFII